MFVLNISSGISYFEYPVDCICIVDIQMIPSPCPLNKSIRRGGEGFCRRRLHSTTVVKSEFREGKRGRSREGGSGRGGGEEKGGPVPPPPFRLFRNAAQAESCKWQFWKIFCHGCRIKFGAHSFEKSRNCWDPLSRHFELDTHTVYSIGYSIHTFYEQIVLYPE